jgi:LysM repeat protein
MVQWPGPTDAAGPERRGARPIRRRRGFTRRPDWLPAAIAGSIAVLLLTTFLLGRTLSDRPAASDPPPVESTEMGAPAAEAPGATGPEQPHDAAAAEAPPTRPIRFTSNPIEATYVVQAGDSLSVIAQRNRTTAEAIQAINNLPDRAVLSVGQRLILP